MGLIKTVTNSVSQALGEQWKEVIEADNMGDQTVFTKGKAVRTDGSNTKGSTDIVTNGSVVHVYPNQFMMLVDGGKVVDYTAEEGYYTVQNSAAPSLFNGQFGETLKDAFGRIQYGGTNPQRQQVFFINLQEIKGIKFGTPNPINYFDNFYNAELFVRSYGEYSVRITNPLRFYEQVIPKNTSRVQITDVNGQYMSEFLQAYQSSLNQLSVDGVRISQLFSKAPELSKKMQECLDEDWNQNRGFEVDHVGVSSISYTDESQELINIRNKGAMMSDPSVREGYVQANIAEGIKAAGSNKGGAAAGFMGVGMGMNMGGSFMGAASNTNFQQMQMQQAQMQQAQMQQPQMQQAQAQDFQAQQPQQAAAGRWFCPNCGAPCDGNFCSKCGTKRPQA